MNLRSSNSQGLPAIVAIPWDLLTLPIRCLTTPVRWTYYLNASKKEPSHPVIDLIKTSPHFDEAMKVGYVYLEAHTSNTKVTQVMGEFLWQGNQVKTHPKWAKEPLLAEETNHQETRLVNLKALPWSQEESSRKDWKVEYTKDWEKGVWYKDIQTHSSQKMSSLAG